MLEEPATRNNLLYAGTGLFLAAWERELMARSSLRRKTAPSTCPDSLWGARSLHVALPAATAGPTGRHDGHPCPCACSISSSFGFAAGWSYPAGHRPPRTPSCSCCGTRSPCCAGPIRGRDRHEDEVVNGDLHRGALVDPPAQLAEFVDDALCGHVEVRRRLALGEAARDGAAHRLCGMSRSADAWGSGGLRMVLSVGLAEARASTNPASTSVSKPASSSSLAGTRCSRRSRRSRTRARAPPYGFIGESLLSGIRGAGSSQSRQARRACGGGG